MNLHLGQTQVLVLGAVEESQSLGDDLGAVYIPLGAELTGEEAGPVRVSISTQFGAAEQVSREAPAALDPAHPSEWSGSIPPEPERLRDAVDAQQRTLLLILSGVTLLIAAVGIMNTFMVAVMERRREVGLRLALGTPPAGILTQFAAESVLTSILGTAAGLVVAVNGIAVVSLIQQWTPVVSLGSIALGAGAGVLVGVLAGIYPAAKASRIDPVQTLTSG